MIDYNKQTQVLEELKVTDNLTLTTLITFDETQVHLKVDYMAGKFTLQRTFSNNYIGMEELGNTMEQFNTEEAVKAYFGL